MSKINNNHILAAALALVESKLQEALADLARPDVSPDDIVKLVETVVDRKFSETPSFDRLTEQMTNQLHQRIESSSYMQRGYTDDAVIKMRDAHIGLKTALDTHNHDKAYADIGHDHNASYAPLNAFNDHNHDGVYTKHETTQALANSVNSKIIDAVTATLSELDALDAKAEGAAKATNEKIDGHVADLNKRIDGHDNRSSEIETFLGKTASAHGELRNDFNAHVSNQKSVADKLKAKIAAINDSKADNHDHPYAAPDHSHDEFDVFLRPEHMQAINDHVNQIDQSHSQEITKLFDRLDGKLDTSAAITRDDLNQLKSEVINAANDAVNSIPVPKDAWNWDFKQHPNRQGTMMYKREDWSHWKTMQLFNDGLLKEVMSAVNRMSSQPTQQGGLAMGGPAYQDPREIISHGSLNDLMDVDTKTVQPSTNDVFMWDSLSNQWVPRTVQEFAAVILPILENDLNTQYNKLVDVIDPLTMYVGEALPGTATSSPTWRIKKITEISGGDISVLWADGSADFSRIWDNRATLNYVI
jgi:hypothetical protein